jgi:hypothetical protein
VAYVIPSGGVIGIDRRLNLLRELGDGTDLTGQVLNANKKALGFADLTVGMSELRLAA